jgi:hypothetical protein
MGPVGGGVRAELRRIGEKRLRHTTSEARQTSRVRWFGGIARPPNPKFEVFWLVRARALHQSPARLENVTPNRSITRTNVSPTGWVHWAEGSRGDTTPERSTRS